jgi:hypothetical protein
VKNNKYDGFIIISATKDKYPVLEFSKGKLPNKIPTVVKKSKSAVLDYATKNQLKIGKSIPIYGGATFYYTEYNLIDSKNALKKKIIVDDVTSNLISLEAKTTLLGKNKVEAVESNKIKKAWDSLESKMALKCKKSGTESIASTSIVTITDVPYETWYRGCAPTSAAMVLEYWDNHGYSNFPRGHTLIDELANAMGTTSSVVRQMA